MSDDANQYGTPYLETEAILAAQERDATYLAEILDRLNEAELRTLAEAASRLLQRCQSRLPR